MKKTMIIDGVTYAVEKESRPRSCRGCVFMIRGGGCRNENPEPRAYCMRNNCVYKKQKQTSAPKKKSNNPTKSTPSPSDPIGLESGVSKTKPIFIDDSLSNQPIANVLNSTPIEAIFDHLRSKGYTGTICKTEKIEL